MDMETKIAIVILALTVISGLIVHFADKNVHLKYKDQRVGVRTKWWRK